MSKIYLSDLELLGNKLKGANLSESYFEIDEDNYPPSNPIDGQLHFDLINKVLQVYHSGEWISIGGTGGLVTPKFTIKTDPSNNLSYLAVNGEWVTDEEGERVFIQKNLTHLIQEEPPIELRPVYVNSWSYGFSKMYPVAQKDRYFGKTNLSDYPDTKWWGEYDYTMKLPFEIKSKEGWISVGFLAKLSDAKKQPIYQELVDGVRYTVAWRVRLLSAGTINITSNTNQVNVEGVANQIYDVAIPFEKDQTTCWISVICPEWDTPNKSPLRVLDNRFIKSKNR